LNGFGLELNINMKTFDKILEWCIYSILEFLLREKLPRELEQVERKNKDIYIYMGYVVI